MFKRRFACCLLLVVVLGLAFYGLTTAQGVDQVDVLTFKGTVAPVSAQYISRGIDTAVSDGAQALIIEMDTPGGLDSSMRQIIQKMLASPVPVVVYVSPPGARAGSAGVFLAMAAHVAVMAPSTNIGAAHPVGGQGEEITGTMGEKVTNDAVAYIRTLAENRGRNADWAEEAVRKSVSITADQAVEMRVVDFVATDMGDLLQKLDGRQVSTNFGPRTLRTKNAAINYVPMNLQENFLHTITDPTIAYLLLTLGIWALIAEFNNPGSILPGVTGVLCLLLAFVAFGSLPLNWGGVALILVSIVLFILDIKAPTHGILTAGGIIAFILGSLLIFSPFTPPTPAMPPMEAFRVPLWIIVVMTAFSALFFMYAVGAGLRAQRLKVASGMGSMVGVTGVARSDINPVGMVFAASEEWSAYTEGEPIGRGERVRVVATEGLRLKVVKA
jgi:membrane-bound serine protease (ClpP class)